MAEGKWQGASACWLEWDPKSSCKVYTRSSPRGFLIICKVLKAAVSSTAWPDGSVVMANRGEHPALAERCCGGKSTPYL